MLSGFGLQADIVLHCLYCILYPLQSTKITFTLETVDYCIPRTKYVRGILWLSRCYAAASAAASAASAASADISSFSR